MNIFGKIVAVAGLLAVMVGCTTQDARQDLDLARTELERVMADPQIQRSAPRDVTRATEALDRGQRFAEYIGGADDAAHYAYLSRRYSQIAREHSELLLNQERAGRLRHERARLQELLQEARLVDAQQEARWLHDQIASLAASETDRGLVMTLGDVLFKTDSAELQASASRTLLQLLSFLQLNPQRRVRIEGYSDNRGDAMENLILSRARAQTVSRFLSELGIDEGRIEVIGYGEQHPVAENASSRGRAQNRRVEILFSDAEGQLAPPR